MGITIFKLVIIGRYTVRYMFGNHVLRLHWQVTVKLNSDHISDDFIPPQIKILHTVIPYIFSSSSGFVKKTMSNIKLNTSSRNLMFNLPNNSPMRYDWEIINGNVKCQSNNTQDTENHERPIALYQEHHTINLS